MLRKRLVMDGAPAFGNSFEAPIFAGCAHGGGNETAFASVEPEPCRSHPVTPDWRGIVAAVVGRVQAVCGWQRRLLLPDDEEADLDVFLKQTADAIVRAQTGWHRVLLVADLAPLRVDPRFAWKLGTIVAETLANAVRHGLAGRGGLISLTLEVQERGLVCEVLDDGIGSATRRVTGSGQTARIIETLTDDLGGSVEREKSPSGTMVRFVFPEMRLVSATRRGTDCAPRPVRAPDLPQVAEPAFLQADGNFAVP